MGPYNILVPELDVRIRDMDVAAQALRKAITTAAPPRDRDVKQGIFNDALSVVIWHCLKPSFGALAVALLDYIVGAPLGWKVVSVLPMLLIRLAAVSKQRPAAAVIVLCASMFSWLSYCAGQKKP